MNENTLTTFAALVAIDWADQKHDIALLPAGAERSESLQLSHRPQALGEWIAGLRQRFGGQSVAVAVEQKRGALIHALMGYEFLHLYPINPATLANLRKAFKQSGAKSDPLDRDLLLELLQKHRDRLTPWQPDDVQTRHLALLVEDRRAAVNERTRLGEQLLATLKNYFPAMIDLAGPELTTKLACELILRWPELATLQRAKVQTLRCFFYARNFRRPAMLEKRLEALQAAVPLCEDPAIINAGRLKALRLARSILVLLPAIEQYDQQIAALFDAHGDASIFASLPGAGPALAPRLLVVFGSRRDRWRDSLEVATYSGIAPVIQRSGKQRPQVHWRWACPKFLRQSLHEFARCSVRFCPWAKKFYQTQRARGQNHHSALRSLAFKWIRIIFRCWQDHCPYDPARYAPAKM
ncbi:MAG TPA: transposase [Candidatus Limnocylindrales bacterium]|nr:transposase [Candidatus Limnocylindrales bacterium]